MFNHIPNIEPARLLGRTPFVCKTVQIHIGYIFFMNVLMCYQVGKCMLFLSKMKAQVGKVGNSQQDLGS